MLRRAQAPSAIGASPIHHAVVAIVGGGECLDAQPGGADGDGVAGLLGRVEDLLDAAVVLGVAPGVQEAADRVQPHHVLKRQRDFGTHDVAQRQIENCVSGHARARRIGSPLRFSAGRGTSAATHATPRSATSRPVCL